MMPAKIQFSPAEQRLLTNAELILTKNRVLQKMQALLEGVQETIVAQAPTFSNAHAFDVSPKISRGENYLGLPYLVLDYPRLFRQDGVFAVRSFFWWGRFFSSTLQLSGRFKQHYQYHIEASLSTFSNHYIGVKADPWQHHFEPDNYQPISAIGHEDLKKLLGGQNHLKLAVKLPVADWAQAQPFLIRSWQQYMAALV